MIGPEDNGNASGLFVMVTCYFASGFVDQRWWVLEPSPLVVGLDQVSRASWSCPTEVSLFNHLLVASNGSQATINNSHCSPLFTCHIVNHYASLSARISLDTSVLTMIDCDESLSLHIQPFFAVRNHCSLLPIISIMNHDWPSSAIIDSWFSPMV